MVDKIQFDLNVILVLTDYLTKICYRSFETRKKSINKKIIKKRQKKQG